MLKYLIILFTLIYCISPAQQDSTVKPSLIKGFVRTEKNKPVEGANLVIEGTIDGMTTDEKGYFEFETQKTGSRNLIVTAVDFGEKILKIQIKEGEILELDITLSKTDYTTDEITVTASSFTSGENSRVTLTPLEITRIPGADADLYRAITTFPGSNQVDEGSRIAVRGGDPNEVLTYLDGASLYNPFVWDDSYNSSTFSTINPWGMKGINFSSGGFSAKFGNVLSAVLDLQTYDMPTTTGLFAILGLANAGLAGVYKNNSGNFGATFSAGQFFVKPFFALNNLEYDYSPVPTASNIGGTLVFKTSQTGLLKVYGNYSYDKIGIRNTSPSFNGYYKGRSHNFFGNVKYSFTPSSVSLLNLSLSFSSLNRNDEYGLLNSVTDNFYSKIRIDYGTPVSGVFDISAGAEYEYNKYILDGTYPLYFYNLGLSAPSFKISDKTDNGRLGAYIESRAKIYSNLLIVGGIRSDYHKISGKAAVDPRLSIVYRVSGNSFLKGATGIYHQNPSLDYFLRGNNKDISPEQAVHYIIGYEYNRENDYILRIEGYYKDYTKLLTYDPVTYITSSIGTGFAKGVDVFLKIRARPLFTGWISYSYTDSKRRQYDAVSETSADYDITHSMSIVGSYNITDRLNAGIAYKVSTGRPYTPVTGSIYDPSQGVYIPIYSVKNSGRFPVFHRIDVNAQYIFALFNRFAVAFLALSNILNTKNLYEYNYSFDYSQKYEVNSTNPRTIYFGMGLQL